MSRPCPAQTLIARIEPGGALSSAARTRAFTTARRLERNDVGSSYGLCHASQSLGMPAFSSVGLDAG
jgi:hypothetical protein